MVTPLAGAAVQLTSNAGSDCWLNCVRVSVGAPGMDRPDAKTSMVKVAVTAAFVPSSAEIVAVYSCTAASAATVPETFLVAAL